METMKLQKKKLLYSLVSMTAILCLLCVSTVLLSGGSLSWLAQNDNVDGSGLELSVANEQIKVEYARIDSQTMESEEFSEIDLESPLNFLESDVWYPGYSMIFNIKITNAGSGAICIDSMGFLAPTESEESPREDNGNFYYLGTQLTASLLAVDQKPYGNATELSLLTLQNGAPDYQKLTLYEDLEQTIKLLPGESIQFTIRLTFTNEDFSQNEYLNFGKGENSGEHCQRRLFVSYVPVK